MQAHLLACRPTPTPTGASGKNEQAIVESDEVAAYGGRAT
jgi:hypothetical protein